MTDLTALTIEEASKALDAGEFDPVDLFEAYLARIERLEPTLNCFITLTAESARQAAEAAAARARQGARLGPLDGVPIALKDNIDVAGVPTTNGLGWAAAVRPEENAAVVRHLKAAGAVLLGKLNMHEGALGATTDNPHHGRTQNPWRPGYTPGGSSGGSGAAVAARLCAAALGTDTMGSVRLPAAYCGVVGLKPTFGYVSQKGLGLLSRDLDCIGPLARTPRDAAIVLAGMVGSGSGDDTTLPRRKDWSPVYTDHATGLAESGRVAVLENFGGVEVEDDVGEAFEKAVATSASKVSAIAFPKFTPTEVRRAGLLISEVDGHDLHAPGMARHPEAYSEAFRGMLEYGRDVSQARLMSAWSKVFQLGTALSAELSVHGVIATPTAAQTAFPFENAPPVNQADFTGLANFMGTPAITVPIGLSSDGLPIGLQLNGTFGGEAKLVALATELWAKGDPLPSPIE